MKTNVAEMSFLFAVESVKLCNKIETKNRYMVITRQLFRSSTAIGALIQEAQHGESLKDFIHKMSISQKECAESIYWLKPLFECEYIGLDEFEYFHAKAQEILRVLKAIILTSKAKLAAKSKP